MRSKKPPFFGGFFIYKGYIIIGKIANKGVKACLLAVHSGLFFSFRVLSCFKDSVENQCGKFQKPGL
jgi:hypothetical protein